MGLPLLVAINSDESVALLKGAGRPVNKLEDRVAVLCALRCVDAVVSFTEETPLRLIEQMQPRLLIKAADYKDKYIVGADFVKSHGGEVWLAPYRHGVSTTEILRKGGADGKSS